MIYPWNNRTTVITLVIMLTTTAICQAQVKTPVSSVKETPAIKNTDLRKQNNIPIKTSTIPATGLKELGKDIVNKLSPGKDLTVVIDDIVDRSTSSDNIYTVHYTLINCGTDDIDITGVVMQGKFSTGKPAGGVTLTANVLNGSSPVLKSGTSFSGTMGTSSKELYANGGPYKLILTADASNKIAESNEKNNTAEAAVVGHLPEPPPLCDPAKKQDIIITNISITKHDKQNNRIEFSYTVKNIGQGYATISQIRAEGTIRKTLGGEVVSTPQTCKCQGTPSSQASKLLQPNESYTFVNDNFPYNYCFLNDLEPGKNYTLILTISCFCAEASTSNNSSFVTFIAPQN